MKKYTTADVEKRLKQKVPPRLKESTKELPSKRAFLKAVEVTAYTNLVQEKEGLDKKIAESFRKNTFKQLKAIKELDTVKTPKKPRRPHRHKGTRDLRVIEGWINQKQLLKITDLSKANLVHFTKRGTFPPKVIRGFYYNPDATIRLAQINYTLSVKGGRNSPQSMAEFKDEIEKLMKEMIPPVDHVSHLNRDKDVYNVV